MMNSNEPLPRLFRAAALATKELRASPSSALENRILIQWRNIEGEDEFAALANLFRRAVAFAACVMLLSAGWDWTQSHTDRSATTALANYALNLQLPP